MNIKLLCIVSALCWMNQTSCWSAEEVDVSKTSMFNDKWLDTIISIEREVTSVVNGQTETKRQVVGTGFLIQNNGKGMLITAAHVIKDDFGSTLTDLQFQRADISGPDSRVSEAELKNGGLGDFYISKTGDVACRYFGKKVKAKDPTTIPTTMFINSTELQVGAPTLVLGYPMGMKSESNDKPIVRNGIVARIDTSRVMLDAFVFPGNSGGPVIYVPPLKVGAGLQSPLINEERLIGLVSEMITYTDYAYSRQTKKVRIAFEENAGLTWVVPAEDILSLIQSKDVVAQGQKIDQLIPSNTNT